MLRAHTFSGSLSTQDSAYLRLVRAWKGRGLRVNIRPERRYENCQDCGARFSPDNGFRCNLHNREPRYTVLDITGLKTADLSAARSVGKHRVEIRRMNGVKLSLDMAVSLKARIEAEIMSGVFRPQLYTEGSRHLKFSAFAERYIRKQERRYERKEISIDHLADIRSAFGRHFGYLEPMEIRSIGPQALADWIEERRRKKVSAKRINKLLTYLGGLFQDAMMMEIVNSNPVAKRLRIPVSKERRRPAPERVWIEIIASIEEKHRPFFMFGYLTGWRWKEISGLQISDIDWQAGAIYRNHTLSRDGLRRSLKRREKTGAPYPITPDIEPILREATRDRIAGHVFVYRSTKTGGMMPYRASRAGVIWRAACEKAEHEGLKKHLMRHSLATRLKSQGRSDEEIAAVLGNTSGVVRAFYASYELERLAQILDLSANVRKFHSDAEEAL